MTGPDTVKLLERIINESREADRRFQASVESLEENQRQIMLAVAGLADEFRELRAHNQDQHNRAGARIRELERAQKTIKQHPALQTPAE